MKYLIYTVITLTLVLSSCSKAKKTDYTAKNEQEIKNYISQNHLSAHRSDSGLYYIIKNPGTGTNPTENSNVTVAYKGYFTDGTVFDQSSDKGISFGLDQVIKGWTEGIPYFKTGGNGVLLVPAHLGYGSEDSNGIPGGSVLVFDVKLNSIN